MRELIGGTTRQGGENSLPTFGLAVYVSVASYIPSSQGLSTGSCEARLTMNWDGERGGRMDMGVG